MAEAIPLYRGALADCERVRGTDHPSTLKSRNNLAMAYRAAGRTAEAIPLLERTLADCERVLGAGHPDTAEHPRDGLPGRGADGRGDLTARADAHRLRADAGRRPPGHESGARRS